MKRLHIVGGGLAGCEAAWQGISAGIPVSLYEMRPKKSTEAHKTGSLAELVCSNSLKSMGEGSAPGLLKKEMGAFDSLILQAAEQARVPAGHALAVDREKFSTYIEERLKSSPLFQRVDLEVEGLPSPAEAEASNECWIVATGPLSSPGIVGAVEKLCNNTKRHHFYDAIAPILDTDSIDMEHAFYASRYDKGTADYLNAPLNKEEYDAFIQAVKEAEYVPLHHFEDTKYFEACLPIEVMVERGPDTLRFGPMKPVGLRDPKTDRRPYACVQLRRENDSGTMFSMVGFQTKMKWGEQKRVFSLIPALKNAEYFRFGSVHRNSYFDSPNILSPDLSLKTHNRVFLAGQITGVEGYTESTAIGLLAAKAAIARINGATFVMPPATTVMGALKEYVTMGSLGKFQPMNANLGLLPAMPRQKKESKADRKLRQCQRAAAEFGQYFDNSP